LTGSAFAAEPLPPPPPPPPPVFTWTGVYIGGQIGGAWGSGALSNFNGFDPFTGAFVNTSLGGTPSGVIGGGHVGYQVQINQWVLGVEGSVDGTSLRKTAVAAFPNFFGGSVLTTQTTADVQGSIRGKLGIAWDRFMIYGTGGVAFGGFNTNFQFAAPNGIVVPPFFASNNFSTTRVGWTAGGGAQYAVTPNWWVFVEYRFSDFGTVRSGAFPNLPTGVFFNGQRRIQENQVQAGFSYKFDLLPPPAPMVAKY
jgi:outer membrane immunogenic protein